MPPYPPSYQNNNMPPYPPNGNFSPNPLGFDALNNNYTGHMPPYPSQHIQQFPSTNSYNTPNFNSSFNINDGFPIAPSNTSNFSPPSFNNQPEFNRPNYPNYPSPNVPPPPVYESQNIQPSYPTLTNSNHSGSNLYPNLVQNNSHQTSYNQSLTFANPTLRPFQPFNPAFDAEQLYKAMKGFGTDETKLIDVLCKRTFAQRNEISQVFKTSYGKDLIRNIESETSGNFRQVLVALLQRPMVVEAIHLRESVAGMGTDENALIDVVCTKTNTEMMELKQTYLQCKLLNLKKDLHSYFKIF